MAIELKMLAASVVLGFVHIVLASHAKSWQFGYRWTASARDDPKAPPAGVAGRLERASANFLETFPFFAVAVLMAHAMGRHGALTLWGVQLYFWAGRLPAALCHRRAPGALARLERRDPWNRAVAGRDSLRSRL
jgi:uncharacterized MAPEG superfamily protein